VGDNKAKRWARKEKNKHLLRCPAQEFQDQKTIRAGKRLKLWALSFTTQKQRKVSAQLLSVKQEKKSSSCNPLVSSLKDQISSRAPRESRVCWVDPAFSAGTGSRRRGTGVRRGAPVSVRPAIISAGRTVDSLASLSLCWSWCFVYTVWGYSTYLGEVIDLAGTQEVWTRYWWA